MKILRDTRGYTVDVKDIGKFQISNRGRLLRYDTYTTNNRLIESFIAGNITPLLFSLKGLVVLHSAVVLIGNEAVALMAPSGYGKTSLSVSLLNRGCKLLSDDLCRIRHRGKKVTAQSNEPYLSVPNSNPLLNGLGAVVYRGPVKSWVKLKPKFYYHHEASLSLVYSLRRGKRLRIETLHDAEALQSLVMNAYKLASIFDMEKLHAEMQTLARLINDGLKVKTLYVPRGWNNIEKAAKMILRDVREN